jgi:hypothetical protein
MALCKDCKEHYWWDLKMVVVNDELWSDVSDNKSDHLCSDCMETRLGRPIERTDFKKGIDKPDISCNLDWFKKNR